MEALALLTTLRRIANDTISHCLRQEFKADVIYTLHNEKLANIENLVNSSTKINRSIKLKYTREVSKLKLAPTRIKEYSLILEEVRKKILTLTPASDFIRR